MVGEPHQFILLCFCCLQTLTHGEVSSEADIPPDQQTDSIPGSSEPGTHLEPQTHSDPHSEGQDHDRATQTLQPPAPSASPTLVTPTLVTPDQPPPPAPDQAYPDDTPPPALLPQPTEGSGDAPPPPPSVEAVPAAEPPPEDILDPPTSRSVDSVHTR